MNADNPLYCACCHCVRQAGDFTYRRGVRAKYCNVCSSAYGRSLRQHRSNECRMHWKTPKLDMSIPGKPPCP